MKQRSATTRRDEVIRRQSRSYCEPQESADRRGNERIWWANGGKPTSSSMRCCVHVKRPASKTSFLGAHETIRDSSTPFPAVFDGEQPPAVFRIGRLGVGTYCTCGIKYCKMTKLGKVAKGASFAGIPSRLKCRKRTDKAWQGLG